jgi:hypothetical protein
MAALAPHRGARTAAAMIATEAEAIATALAALRGLHAVPLMELRA